MIPHTFFETDSEGEIRIFEALQSKLSNEYTVFHSVRWIGSDRKRSQGEADFLIFHPTRGLMVIEVKAGIIQCSDNRTWYQTNRNSGVTKEIYDPEKQASESKFKLLQVLKGTNILVCHAVWFPSISYSKEHLPLNYDKDMLFDMATLLEPETAINRAFEFWKQQIGITTTLSASESKKIIEIVAPELNLIPSVSQDYTFREERFLQLTNEQAKILDFLRMQNIAVINGSAGTGKTVLAIEKARQLTQDGRKVLFLCYNSLLAKHLDKNYSHYGFDIFTFDGLSQNFVGFQRNFNFTRSQFLEYLIDEDNVFEYTDLIVDEGQDFENDWLEYLETRIGEDGSMYVFYDEQQCLYYDEVNKWIRTAPCKITLYVNCRNTEAIAKTAYGTLGSSKKVPNLSGIEGEQPVLLSYEIPRDLAIALDKLVNKFVVDTKSNKGEVAILTMNSFENSVLSEVQTLSKLKFSESKESDLVCLTTARKFKGLEANLVIITDLDWSKLNEPPYRKLFYTTCSRAKHNLYINANKIKEEEIDFILQSFQGEGKRRRRGKSKFLKLLNLKEYEDI